MILTFEPFFSKPTIQLTWTKDGAPLLASTRFTTNYEPTTGDIDVIINFVKRVDTGDYKCVAENIHGADVTFTSIKIIDVPGVDDTPQTANPNAFQSLDLPALNGPVSDWQAVDDELNVQPPVVIIPLTDTLVVEEEPLVLSCKIIGNPKPKVVLLTQASHN